MRISFIRTGERRYAVAVERSQASDLRMDPAPGYDALLPHDLVHAVVEMEFGLRDGIFGQVAAGGDAHTFVPTDELRTKAWGRKMARRNKATGTQIGRSEELAAVVFPMWLRRQGHVPPHLEAPRLAPKSDLDQARVDRALTRLDDLSAQWRALGVGESMSIEWPWPERAARRASK